MLKNKIIWLVAIAACAIFFNLIGDDSLAESPASPPPAPIVKVSSPKKQLITEWDEYTGRFEATKRVEIRSRISGYLQEIHFKDGQKVNKGDPLFTIDQRPLKIALESAKAKYDVAEKEYKRAKGLRTNNVVSQAVLERTLGVYLEAKSMVEDAKLQLEFSAIKSPISGRASRHLVDVGNLVSGGNENATLLTTIVSEDPIHFYFDASEQDLLKYSRLNEQGKRSSSRDEAKPVQVKLQDETDFVHNGKMDFVDNEIDKNTGSIQGRAILPNPDGILISGMFGRLRIAGSDAHEALLIPDEAIATNQNQKIIYMVNEKNMVETRNIQIGALHEGKWRIVVSGLKENDKIIWSGLAKVRPNMSVTPQDIAAEETSEPNIKAE